MTEAHERQVHRTSPTSSLLDVLDRVLDKGIVIDAWVRLSPIGIELVTVEARVVVASIATYLGYSEALAELKTAASQADHSGETTASVSAGAPGHFHRTFGRPRRRAQKNFRRSYAQTVTRYWLAANKFGIS